MKIALLLLPIAAALGFAQPSVGSAVAQMSRPSSSDKKETLIGQAAPTPTPNQYVYHSCDVYPANDAFTTGIAGSSVAGVVDPNSSAIIGQLPSGDFDSGDSQSLEQVNLGTSSTSTYVVQAVTGGHSPPLYNSTTMPWKNGFFIESTSDGHAVVLLTDTCAEYETYQTAWSPGMGLLALSAYDGQKNDLSATWLSQAVNGNDATTVSGIPLLGTTDFGEDASLPIINHILQLLMQTGQGVSQYGYIFPATHPSFEADTGCSSGPCHHPLHMGDVLLLDDSYDCTQGGTVDAKGQLICVQMKYFGLVLSDQASSYSLRFGLKTNGAEGWSYNTDLKPLLENLTISNFVVKKEGTIECDGTPCY